MSELRVVLISYFDSFNELNTLHPTCEPKSSTKMVYLMLAICFNLSGDFHASGTKVCSLAIRRLGPKEFLEDVHRRDREEPFRQPFLRIYFAVENWSMYSTLVQIFRVGDNQHPTFDKKISWWGYRGRRWRRTPRDGSGKA